LNQKRKKTINRESFVSPTKVKNTLADSKPIFVSEHEIKCGNIIDKIKNYSQFYFYKLKQEEPNRFEFRKDNNYIYLEFSDLPQNKKRKCVKISKKGSDICTSIMIKNLLFVLGL